MKFDLPPFNEKVPHNFFEQTILDFSSDLFKTPYLGYTIAFLLNILYIYTYCKSKSCISIIIYLFLTYLLSSIILSQLAQFTRKDKNEKKEVKKEIKDEAISDEKLKTLFKEVHASIEYFKNFLKKTISLEDKLHTFRTLIELYLLMKVTSFLNDKIILILVSNIIIFYAIIEEKYPYFVLKSRMAVRQVIEGVIVLILCVIPRYEEEKKENNKKLE